MSGCRTMPAGQFDVWARMVGESHPWVPLVKTNANYDGTSNARYVSRGRWAALYYLMTGDATYAAKSYAETARVSGNFQTPTRVGNDTREHSIEDTLRLDWLRPALSESEQATYRNWLVLTADGVLAAGLRTADSDQTSGTYGYFALMDAVCGTDYLTRDIKENGSNKIIPVGGLDATACDRTTLRNCLRQYIEDQGAGGQWIESWEYNLGTPFLVYMTWISLLTAHGVDHLPEFAAWLKDQRIYHRHELLPELKEPFQWGDCQAPHELHWTSRDTIYAMLRVGDPTFESFARDVYAAGGRTPFPTSSAPLYARFYYYTDPYAAATEWQTTTPLQCVTPGTGHAYWRTGWSEDDRATHFHCTRYAAGGFVDHQANVQGHLQVARGGQYLLDYVVAYSSSPLCANQLLVVGSAPSRESGGLTDQSFLPGVFAYAAGTNTGMGPDLTSKSYNPPPTYLHENTRAVFELLDGDETLLVIYDRIHTDDPRTQLTASGKPAIERYPAAAQTRMKAAPGLKDILWHTPVAPTMEAVEPRRFSWLLPNTTLQAEVRQVLPTRNLAYTVVDERPLSLGHVKATELKWCVHATAPADATLPSFELFLHLLIGGEGSSGVEAVAIDVPPVAGVLLRRPPSPTVAVLFSATPGPIVTFNQASYEVVRAARTLDATFAFTLPEAARVYLVDFDPDATWAATDGTGAVLTLTRYGSVLTLTAEPGTLTLYCNETPPPPPEPPVAMPEWRVTESSSRRIVLER